MERDQHEFEKFYAVARDGCLRVVLISVGDRQLAEDLVADVFTRAWMSWPKVCEHPAPHAWVVRTACHPYPADMALLQRAFPNSYQPGPPPSADGVIVINPSGLPAGAGVHLSASISQPPALSEVAAPVLVYASPGCTGS